MKSAYLFVIVIALWPLTAMCTVFAQSALNGERGSDEAVRTVVQQYAETWNESDMAAWAVLFTDDVDYVHRGGGWWRSNAANVAGHEKLHERLVSQEQAMNLQLTVADVDYLHADIALVHVISSWPELDLPEGIDAEGGIMTMLMVRRGGAWRIRALQNTLRSLPNP